VAGVVLSAGDDAPESEMSGVVEQRVGDTLRQRLPSNAAHSLRVRVVQQGPLMVGNV